MLYNNRAGFRLPDSLMKGGNYMRQNNDDKSSKGTTNFVTELVKLVTAIVSLIKAFWF